jgi:hypothetical protein
MYPREILSKLPVAEDLAWKIQEEETSFVLLYFVV